jgi:hypothetical protein
MILPALIIGGTWLVAGPYAAGVAALFIAFLIILTKFP